MNTKAPPPACRASALLFQLGFRTIFMTVSSAISFRKTIACPSSGVLLSYRAHSLSREIMSIVRHHLSKCDFCSAEIPLLSFYQKPRRGECKAPEIPINLRILAESLLAKHAEPRKKRVRRKSLKLLIAEQVH